MGKERGESGQCGGFHRDILKWANPIDNMILLMMNMALFRHECNVSHAFSAKHHFDLCGQKRLVSYCFLMDAVQYIRH
jgi:hypothetical protein|tara:strand:- start:758 stop:991 length:234 start_codon:yes stop_codon:yes gene_type:complete